MATGWTGVEVCDAERDSESLGLFCMDGDAVIIDGIDDCLGPGCIWYSVTILLGGAGGSGAFLL